MAEKRLIDAKSFAEHLERMARTTYPNLSPGLFEAAEYAKDFPTVDAVEVVHGHWKEYSHSALVRWKDGEPVFADRSVFRCSRCDFGTIAKHNYCPSCGAKMDGGNDG